MIRVQKSQGGNGLAPKLGLPFIRPPGSDDFHNLPKLLESDIKARIHKETKRLLENIELQIKCGMTFAKPLDSLNEHPQ